MTLEGIDGLSRRCPADIGFQGLAVDHVNRPREKRGPAMRTRRQTVEHPFGTIKMRMGATHFLCKTLPKVATEMALCVLTYNLTRVLNIAGVEKLLAAITA